MLRQLSDKAILTLARCAKKPGARPFFRHPKAMIELRKEAAKRSKRTTK